MKIHLITAILTMFIIECAKYAFDPLSPERIGCKLVRPDILKHINNLQFSAFSDRNVDNVKDLNTKKIKNNNEIIINEGRRKLFPFTHGMIAKYEPQTDTEFRLALNDVRNSSLLNTEKGLKTFIDPNYKLPKVVGENNCWYDDKGALYVVVPKPKPTIVDLLDYKYDQIKTNGSVQFAATGILDYLLFLNSKGIYCGAFSIEIVPLKSSAQILLTNYEYLYNSNIENEEYVNNIMSIIKSEDIDRAYDIGYKSYRDKKEAIKYTLTIMGNKSLFVLIFELLVRRINEDIDGKTIDKSRSLMHITHDKLLYIIKLCWSELPMPEIGVLLIERYYCDHLFQPFFNLVTMQPEDVVNPDALFNDIFNSFESAQRLYRYAHDDIIKDVENVYKAISANKEKLKKATEYEEQSDDIDKIQKDEELLSSSVYEQEDKRLKDVIAYLNDIVDRQGKEPSINDNGIFQKYSAVYKDMKNSRSHFKDSPISASLGRNFKPLKYLII